MTKTPPSLNKYLNKFPNKLVFYLAWHRPLQHNLQLVHQPRKQMKTIQNRKGMEARMRTPNLLTQKAGPGVDQYVAPGHKHCPGENRVQARAGDVQDEQMMPCQWWIETHHPHNCTLDVALLSCPSNTFRCRKVQIASFNGYDFRCQWWQRELGEVKSVWSSKNAD